MIPFRARTAAPAASSIAVLLAAAAVSMAAPIPSPHVHPIADPLPVMNGMFGTSVAGLGDVDGDGVGDLVVSAIGAERVFVVSGSDRSLIRTLTDPDGLSGNRFGAAVAGVGDVNGDAVEDIAVGAPGDDLTLPLPCLDPNNLCPPQPFQGRAFLFSGADGSLIRRLQPPGDQFLALGFSFARLGDLDGDGTTEIAVGSPTRRSGSFGQVFAFSGAGGALLWTSAEADHQGLASYGQFLAPIDDVNGDGRRDLLVAAIFHDVDPDPIAYTLAGRVYVVSGLTGQVIRIHDDPAPADGDVFGAGITGLPDENGDGIDEYAIGGPVQATVWVHRGSDGALLRTIAAPGGGASYFGFPLVRGGDYDGDARDDLWAGASRSGAIHLLTAGGAILSTVPDPTPPAQPEMAGGFGWSLAVTADYGDDAQPDLIAGEPEEPENGSAKSGAAFVVVNDRPPVAACASITVPADPACTAAVAPSMVDAGSSDPDGDPLTFSLAPPGPYGLGANAVTLTVEDGRGASDTCAATITVVDQTPPSIAGATASPSLLWPPDHRLVDVTVAYAAADNCAAPGALQCALTAASSEPVNGTGDGDTAPDAEVVDAHRVRLRAERAGLGPGRTYTTTITCADPAGNAASADVTVSVPHDAP